MSTSTASELRKWMNGHFSLIKEYKSDIHRRILEMAVIDAFSQLYKKHTKCNQKYFVEFLVAFGGEYSEILESVCPVILYYNEFMGKEELRILNSSISMLYSADDSAMLKETKRLMALLSDEKKEKSRIKYSYAGLIYQMRNKMFHEMKLINMPMDFYNSTELHIPYIARERPINSSETKWSLNIPESFVVTVGKTAINNFLDKCERDNKNIDLGNGVCYLKWYD